jgi:hypothetical protein
MPSIDSPARSGRFSGVVSVSRASVLEFERASELADRRQSVPCTADTVFAIAIASGLGFWLHPSGPAVILEGCDYGLSFHSGHDPTTGVTHTVMANPADGAWPISRLRQTLTP